MGTGKKKKEMQLESGYDYSARWFNPRDGSFVDIQKPRLDQNGVWSVPVTPGSLDWVLLLENKDLLEE